MGGAAPAQVLRIQQQLSNDADSALPSAPHAASASLSVPKPTSPRRSAGSDPPVIASDTSGSASSSYSGSKAPLQTLSSASSGSSSPSVQRSSRFKQALRGWQKPTAESASPGSASPDLRSRGSGGAWQRLWRKGKRDSANEDADGGVVAPGAGSGGSLGVSSSSSGGGSAGGGKGGKPDDRRTVVWCVGDLVLALQIDRRSSVDDLRESIATAARASDFDLPPTFTLWVERSRSLVQYADVFGAHLTPLEVDTQLLVDGLEFRYLVLPSDFSLDGPAS
jgi:hypothetical protein